MTSVSGRIPAREAGCCTAHPSRMAGSRASLGSVRWMLLSGKGCKWQNSWSTIKALGGPAQNSSGKLSAWHSGEAILLCLDRTKGKVKHRPSSSSAMVGGGHWSSCMWGRVGRLCGHGPNLGGGWNARSVSVNTSPGRIQRSLQVSFLKLRWRAMSINPPTQLADSRQI